MTAALVTALLLVAWLSWRLAQVKRELNQALTHLHGTLPPNGTKAPWLGGDPLQDE